MAQFTNRKQSEGMKLKDLAKYGHQNQIGSIHWFRTLMAQLKHMGEYIRANSIESKLLAEYGQQSYNIACDLIEWQESHTPLYDSPEEKLYTTSEVEKIREASFEAGYKASKRQAGEAMYMEYEYKDYSESNPLK